jgi:branched-chain amino acid transport system substrate-binding protein
MQDTSTDLFLFAVSTDSSAMTADAFLTLYTNLFREPSMNVFASSTLGKKDEVTLGDGTKALRQALTGKHSSGTAISMQITCAKANNRLYAFIFFGSNTAMKTKDGEINGMYQSIYLSDKPQAGGGAGGSGGTIQIAILGPMTGSLSSFGASTSEGALLAIDEWNARGGVLGKKIVAVIGDGQCQADAAVNAFNKTVKQNKIHYMIGEVCSGATIPLAELANAQGVVQISPTATNESVTVDASGKTRPYTFRACFIDAYQGQAGASFASKNLEARTAFILLDPNNDYSKLLADTFEKFFVQAGGEIVAKEPYSGKDTDFNAILNKAASLKPDVIYLPDYYNVVNLVTKQARAKGITAPFIGGDGWDSSDLDLQAAAGSYFTNHYSSEDSNPAVVNFVKAYGAQYKDKGAAKKPDALAALAYDATNLMLEGIKATGVDDPAKVKDTLAKIQFNGVAGKIAFDAKHNPLKSVTILAVKADGVHFETAIQP